MEPKEKIGSFTFEKSFKEPPPPPELQIEPVMPEPIVEIPLPAEPPVETPAEPKPPTTEELTAQLTEWKTKATEYETKTKTFEQQLAEYNSKIEELSKPVNPFEGENSATYYKLSQIEKTNKEKLPIYQELFFGNPDAKKLWKLKFVDDNPEYKDQPEVVQRMLERKFPALFSSEIDPEEQEFKDQQIDLSLEAKKIKREMLSLTDGIKPPDVVDRAQKEVQSKAQKEELVKTWKNDFSKYDTDVMKRKVEIQVDKDKLSLEMEIPKEQKEKYLRSAAQIVLAANLPNNAETVKQVEDVIWREYIADNFVAEASKLVKDSLKQRDDQWKKLTGGKPPIKSTDVDTKGVFDARGDFAQKLSKHSHKY